MKVYAAIEIKNPESVRPEWVRHEDYLILQAALREALDRGREMAGLLGYTIDLYRIQELRKRFLEEFDAIE